MRAALLGDLLAGCRAPASSRSRPRRWQRCRPPSRFPRPRPSRVGHVPGASPTTYDGAHDRRQGQEDVARRRPGDRGALPSDASHPGCAPLAPRHAPDADDADPRRRGENRRAQDAPQRPELRDGLPRLGRRPRATAGDACERRGPLRRSSGRGALGRDPRVDEARPPDVGPALQAHEDRAPRGGIRVELETQDDHGYYSYGFDVFPGHRPAARHSREAPSTPDAST